jgi:nitroreductase
VALYCRRAGNRNARPAGRDAPGGQPALGGASAGADVERRPNITASGRIATHALYDVGLAVANLTVQATAFDLFVHQMGGFYPEKARALFAIPDGFEPVTMLAIGYLGAPETLDERLRERELMPRTRRPLSEFVFEETWGKVAELVG